jgi:hypothetical protein
VFLGDIITKRQVEHKRSIRKQISGRLIDASVQKTGDWRGAILSRLRILVKQADPKVVEEVKWIKPTNPLGTMVWSHEGLISTCETYKNHVKMTFPRGASLDDPSHLFNSSLDARVWRAIDFHEGDKINERALKDLIRSAIALNAAALEKKNSTARPKVEKK